MIFEGMIRKTKTKNSKKPPQLFKVSSHVTLAFSSNSRKKINATFLLVNEIKMVGMLLSVVHRQVHKNV